MRDRILGVGHDAPRLDQVSPAPTVQQCTGSPASTIAPVLLMHVLTISVDLSFTSDSSILLNISRQLLLTAVSYPANPQFVSVIMSHSLLTNSH